MKNVVLESNLLEKLVKQKFNFPEFIMMENAASSLEKQIDNRFKHLKNQNKKFYKKSQSRILILCGTGNNGADGLALARRIFKKYNVFVLLLGNVKTFEGKKQLQMAKSLEIPFVAQNKIPELLQNLKKYDIIVDCIYGTGFHGNLSEEEKILIQNANNSKAYKIACDIPSGIDKSGKILTKDCQNNLITFKANLTVTMGTYKVALFSDQAKDFTGKIKVSKLGLSKNSFTSILNKDFKNLNEIKDFFSENSIEVQNQNFTDFQNKIYLIEKKDINLPNRKKLNVHKGTFGHASIIIGQKCGAAILAGTAALKFGCGLVSCVKTKNSNPNDFLMNPELMLINKIPEKTNAILLGSGLGTDENSQKITENIIDFVKSMQNPKIVLDADFFYNKNLYKILNELNNLTNKNAQIILTPHPKELFYLALACKIDQNFKNQDFNQEFVIQNRLKIGFLISEKLKNLVFVLKGANTYIFSNNKCFICNCGSSSLAKAGSGDVLAGFCVSLLSQGYDSLNGAITSVYVHAKSSNFFEKNYSLTPFSLIEKVTNNF